MARGTGKKCLVMLHFGHKSASYANVNIAIFFFNYQIENRWCFSAELHAVPEEAAPGSCR